MRLQGKINVWLIVMCFLYLKDVEDNVMGIDVISGKVTKTFPM